jgi:DNA-binding transcriptional LysR family regulator
LRKTAALLDELDATLLGLQGVAATRMGEVTLACVPSTVYYYVSQVVRRFREEFPRVRVKVLDTGANEVLGLVLRGEADFGLDFVGSQEPDLEFITLHEERFVLACRRDHPLAKKRRVAWAELAACEFLSVTQESGNRLLIDQALAGVAVRPVSVCEAQHVTTLLGLVEAGLGVAAVPAMAMPPHDHPVLVSVPLDEPVVSRRVGLIRRRGRALAPAAQPLFDAFVAMAPSRARGRRHAPRKP